MRMFILLLTLAVSFTARAQVNPQPCSAAEARQFDFWVGEWELTWSDSLHGSNRIEKMFGNCTIHENFSDPKLGYLGQSWSVYNPGSRLWQQTWVDNRGGYIVLTGGMDGGRMILKTGERQTPKGPQEMRMVFSNITSDSFDWSWESSTDKGVTWKPGWVIHYVRKK